MRISKSNVLSLALIFLFCPARLLAQAPTEAWYLRITPLGNELWRIAALFATILVGLVAGRLVKYLLTTSGKRLEAKGRGYRSVALKSLAGVATSALALVGLRVGLQFLNMVPAAETMSDTVTSILATLIVAYAAYRLVDVLDVMMLELAERTESRLDDMLRPLVRTSLRTTIVVLTLVQVATVLSDKPMTSIIAGLGVGGLAVGLAAQDMVKNLFGSLMILSDHPFEMGDFIETGGHGGSVEAVGFRSTKLRTSDGHVVTIPNGSLANMVVSNVSERPFLKRSFNLGLTYDMTPQQVQRAIEVVKEILQHHPGRNEDKPPLVNFTEFGDSALNLQVRYWHFPADWQAFRVLNDHVNIEILRRFNEEGIELAFPTHMVHLVGGAASSS
jgi:MscS family membrane protein